MNNNEKIKTILSIITTTIFLVTMTAFVYLPKQENLLSSMAFIKNINRFYIQDLSDGILLRDATPMSDKKGTSLEPFRFKVVNNSNKDITYRIVFLNNEKEANARGMEILNNRYLRYTLKDGNNEYLEPENLAEDGILYETTIAKNSEAIFEFKMWLDFDADNGAMNKVFIGTIELVEM